MTFKDTDGVRVTPLAVFLLSICAVAIIGIGSVASAQPFPPADDPQDEARQEAARQARAAEYFAEGQQLLAENKIIQAKTKFKAAIGMVGLTGVGQSAFQALTQIHSQGMGEIQKAIELAKQQKYIEALELARATRSIYANLFAGLNIQHNYPNIARLAREIEEKLEKDPTAQAQIQEKEASGRLPRIRVLERVASEDPARYYDLYKAYRRVAKRFPNCPTGQDCATQMESLRNDKKIWRMINDERKCRWIEDKLQTISMCEANGMTDKARETYEELTKRFGKRTPEEFRQLVAEKRPKPEKEDDERDE